MKEQFEHFPRSLWWVLIGLTFAWGFNWTAMKVALSEIAPLTFRALCLGLGSGVLFVFLRAQGQPLGVPKGQWARLAMIAFLSVTCWNVLVVFALTMIASGRAAILAYTMPAWAIPLAAVFLRERMNGRKLLGLALGMGGMALLLGDEITNLRTAPLGSLLVLGAAFTWALGTVLLKKYPVAMPLPAYAAWVMLLGGVPILAGAIAFDLAKALAGGVSLSLWPALGLAYNVFIAFAWGHWALFKLATSVPVSVFSLSMMMTPVLGVFSGMVFLGERPSWAEYTALLLVLGSLLAVMVPQKRT